MSVTAQGISKTFGPFQALRNVSLHVPEGELVALLGPSGSGKTTLLRIIAGLEVADAGSGSILLHDQDVSRRKVADRRIGFVFQHYALFGHMTVFENVAFGLRVRPWRARPGRGDIRDRVLRLLKLVQLEGLEKRYPAELSGGQRQRVALARAMAVEPQVLLLDEPFGALDAKVRQELRRWLRRLHEEVAITSLFVTHDQEEAFEVADRVVVMNKGQIEQAGTPEEVFHHPINEFVMDFLGGSNVFEGRLQHGHAHFESIAMECLEQPVHASGKARVFVRPQDLEIQTHRNGRPSFPARIHHANAAGPQVKIELLSEGGERLEAEVSQERYHELQVTSGSLVYVSPRRIRVFR